MSEPVGTSEHQPSSITKVIVASLIGTTIEWYDFFLYGTAAALVFNKLFFPTSTRWSARCSRSPLRGRLRRPPARRRRFGHFGDRSAARSMLVATLLLMGVAPC